MKINSVNFNTSFKSSNVLGHSDDISALRREGMRQRIEDRNLYNVDFFLKEGRKSEPEQQEMIDSLIRTQKAPSKGKKVVSSLTSQQDIDIEKYDEFLNSVWEKVGNFDIVNYDNKVLRGACLSGKTDVLKMLKEEGIDTIIAFSDSEKYRKSCEQEGLKYKSVPIPDAILLTPPFIAENKYIERLLPFFDENSREESLENVKKIYSTESRLFIDEFVDYIQTVQKGNCYVGCDFGQNRTGYLVVLDNLFNPMSESYCFPP